MTMSQDRGDREWNKFVEGAGGETLVQVKVVEGGTVTAATSTALDLTSGTVGNRTFTTTFSQAWEISRIQILFSTTVPRDITISNFDGTNLFTENSDTGDTSLTYVYPAQYKWIGTATDEVRLVFSQTLTACTATIRIIYKNA